VAGGIEERREGIAGREERGGAMGKGGDHE
jgi:hypothetical protein